MSDREKCIQMIESVPDDRLAYIAAFLENACAVINEAMDDAYCVALNDRFLDDPDRGEPVPIEELAASTPYSDFD